MQTLHKIGKCVDILLNKLPMPPMLPFVFQQVEFMSAPVLTHQPVLLQESVAGLAIKPNGIYIDGTFGRGGHSQAILRQLDATGRLIVLDKDPQAIEIARKLFGADPRVMIFHHSFTHLQKIAVAQALIGKVDGILLDLGVSSPQLDDPQRGFSFLNDGPLDMRMDTDNGISAAAWLTQVSTEELATVLRQYGEERFAKRIAAAIVKAREEMPIVTTKRLAEIVSVANPAWEKHKHPATRSFQAIRIFINRELEELQVALQQALEILAPHGRLAVISFHSLEDQIVKRFIRKEVQGDDFPAGLPVKHSQLKPRLRWIEKQQRPTEHELINNPRARSATLRIAEKLS